MPYLDNNITQLNEKLISSLNFLPAAKIKAYGIAETMIDVQEVESDGKMMQKLIRYPAIINNDGDAAMIAVDDTYSIILYHRLEAIANTVVPRTTYGRSSEILESAGLAVIIIAFRDKVRKTSYWLENIIKDQFPERLAITDKDDPTKVLQSSVFRIGTSNFDKLALLQREYSEVELNFPQIIIFEIKYRIDTSFKKGCLNNCDSC